MPLDHDEATASIHVRCEVYYQVIDPEGMGYYDWAKAHPCEKGDGAVCNYSHLGNTEWVFPLPVA